MSALPVPAWCRTGKTPLSEADAEAKAALYREHDEIAWRAYYCYFCHGWHLTSQPEPNRRRRKPKIHHDTDLP
jgi:hypothetical protein